MDKWRRGVSGIDSKRGSKAGKGKSSGPGEMIPPQMIPPQMVTPATSGETALGFDVDLLVGPLYESGNRRQDAIREQIGDITSKLHRTLDQFSDIADMEEMEDPLITMKRKIGQMADKDMASELNSFMNRFEDMSQQVHVANQERDEMLLQLADWFTTDHVDLDDIKSSLDDTEAENIKNSYFKTMTTFEKLKNLQGKILNANEKGQPTKQLVKQKMELEKNVFGSFNTMRDMSVQTMKLKIGDDAPWKYAAEEIVSMLKNVRTENAEELEKIASNMKEMVKQLEKQAATIKSLTAELRDKKQTVAHLSDENGDLNQDVAVLRARCNRYDKELQAAKDLIHKLGQQQALATGQPVSVKMPDIEPEPSKLTVARLDAKSKLQVTTPEEPREMSSDPALLRTQLRDQQDTIELIRSEFARVSEELEEMSLEMQEKKAYIDSIETENEKFSKELKKLRAERRKSLAVPQPAAGDGHTCEHCKCHLPEATPSGDAAEEIEELKSEVKKLTDRVAYYKKCLADTELKLSDAYKEISELRMARDEEPVPRSKPIESEQEAKKKETAKPVERTGDAPAPKPKPKVKAKPKASTKSRYMEKSKQEYSKLPPIDKGAGTEPPPDLGFKQTREYNLYRVGDLQGRLNMLTNEIMEFVTEIGRMLHTEKDDSKKVQTMKMFDFADNGAPGQGSNKKKDHVDAKEQEARQKKSQTIFLGQHAVTKLREAYDMLASSLDLQHDEYEAIYRSFKISQQRNAIRRDIMMGRLGLNALREFDKKHMRSQEHGGPNTLLAVYYSANYGDGTGMSVQASQPKRSQFQKKSSSVSLISDTSEAEEKLKETMHVLGMQRSKSDLDVTSDATRQNIMGTGLLRERSQIYLTNVPDHARREVMTTGNKQEVKISKAVVPRKGLIQLTSVDAPEAFKVTGEARKGSDSLPSSAKTYHGGLIRRKDILDQVRMGNKLLEESEQQKFKEEEMSKSLGEYTILDLQSRILEMTDFNNLPKRKLSSGTLNQDLVPKEPKKKGVTLPAINNLKIF